MLSSLPFHMPGLFIPAGAEKARGDYEHSPPPTLTKSEVKEQDYLH